MARRFQVRTDAGRLLAKKLGHFVDRNDVVILGMPRGGVPVAFEVAKSPRIPRKYQSARTVPNRP
jgi:putative phosphoribosyl transferase